MLTYQHYDLCYTTYMNQLIVLNRGGATHHVSHHVDPFFRTLAEVKRKARDRQELSHGNKRGCNTLLGVKRHKIAPTLCASMAFTMASRRPGYSVKPNHHAVAGAIQERIWMLQVAQQDHSLEKPPTNAISIILPEPLHVPKDEDLDSFEEMMPKQQNVAIQMPSVLCVLPKWPRRLRRKRRTKKDDPSIADSSTVRLLDEHSQGEWS